MSCDGCQQAGTDAAAIRRARAIQCRYCPASDTLHSPWDGIGVKCTVTGQPVEAHIESCRPTCPMGRHPNLEGMVGRWYGVPALKRWMLAGQLTGPVPGCGCFAPLKDRWVAFKSGFWSPGESDGLRRFWRWLNGRTIHKGFSHGIHDR